MTLGLTLVVVALLGVAIGVQIAYLRGLKRAGVEVTRATKVVSYVNISLLVIVAIGLLVFGLIGQLTSMGM